MMPTDAKAVPGLAQLIATLAKDFESGASPQKELQDELVKAAEELAVAARDPDENMYFHASQIAHNAAIRSVISMGILDLMPDDDGSAISVKELASKLDLNAELVGRILRASASTHMFSSPSPDHYAHNALSRVYRAIDNRALFAQMYDFTGQGVLAIPPFCESTGWKSPGDYSRGPFQLAVKTGLGYWEYLATQPDSVASFNTGMRVGKIGRETDAFPFGTALEQDPCLEGEVAIVDVGGGRGQSLETIRANWPSITGRMVLQDLPGVVEDAVAKGLPQGIEPCPGSFFDEQPIKGARLYYFRRIFHCWTNEKSREILQNTQKAMDNRSRVLIADMVLPDHKCPRDLAMQDLNMMSLGGMERSESEWRRLLESAGLVMRRVWMNEKGRKHAIVEATLPTFNGHEIV